MRKIHFVILLICMALATAVGVSCAADTYGQAAPAQTQSQFQAGSGPIDINSASKQELMSLPGVGEFTAQDIIDGRPYGNKEQLELKQIVSPYVYDSIKDRIVVRQAPGSR